NRFDGISGEWETAKKIEDNSIEAYQPQIAFDSSGNAIAVWHQDDGAAWHEDDGIWASRFNGTSGEWEAAVKIDTARDPGSASFPQIAFDGNGNAIAVWQQDDGTGSNKDIWASRFNGTSGEWEPAKQIGDGDARHPQIAFDSSGNATAVWLQYNDSDPDPHERLWANRFDGASGEWETAGTIDEDDAGDAQHPQIVFDSSGNAIVVVWSQYYGTYNRIWFNRFDGGTSGEWEDAVKIDKDRDSGQHAQHPQIAFDSNGNAIAVWQQDDGNSTGHNDIWANRFDGTTGKWGDT
ncbi:MAG: hypothetical protein GY939_28890, partial [Actinomycetia bacterium]|nr:hypothetical protein [Actinomycetes bacterium]